MKFFGLARSPFSSTNDPQAYFSTSAHEETVVTLRYTVAERKGCCVVTGPAGSGKSMAVRMLTEALEREGPRASVCQCTATPDLQPGDLLRGLCERFGEACDAADSATELLARVRTQARSRAHAGEAVVLIIDDAQHLRTNALSMLTTLASMEGGDGQGRLISLLMIGDDRFRDTLAHAAMTGLRQHVFRACRIKPLSSEQTAAYVRHRLATAGRRRDDIFGAAALTAVHQITGGVPRLINHLCDNALISSFADGQTTVKASTLREVADEVMIFASPETQEESESGQAPTRRRNDATGNGSADSTIIQAEELADQVQDRVLMHLARPIHEAVDRLGDSIEDARGILAQVEHASDEAADIARRLGRVQADCAPLVDAKDRDLKELADKAHRLLTTSNQIRGTFRHMVKAMRLAKQQIEALNTATAMGQAKIQEFAELQRWADQTLTAVRQAGTSWRPDARPDPGPIVASPSALLTARREKAQLALTRCSRVLEMLRSSPDLFDGARGASSGIPERITREQIDHFTAEVHDARDRLQLKMMPVGS
jgi:type II secretory pathway predicted ATPase ExeA